MFKRLILKLTTVAAVCAFLFGAAISCTTTDPSDNVLKPDFSVAMASYQELETKKSTFSADFSVSLYKKQTNDEYPVAMSITESLVLERILNEGSIYMEGTLKTSHFDETLQSIVNLALQTATGSGGSNASPIYDYLAGKTYVDFKLGYADGVYNAKATYVNDDDNPSFWGATDDESIANLLYNLDIDYELDLASLLMTSGVLDLTETAGWLESDAGGKYFSDLSNSFIYNLNVDKDKLHDIIFSALDGLLSSLGAEYDDYAEFIDQALPYLKKWVSVGPSTLDAYVNRSGLPDRMTTSMRINLNINQTELLELVNIISPKNSGKISAVLTMMGLFGICGTDGATNTIGLAYDIVLTETFSYGESDCSLANADSDLFLPLTEDNEERYALIIEREEKDGE